MGIIDKLHRDPCLGSLPIHRGLVVKPSFFPSAMPFTYNFHGVWRVGVPITQEPPRISAAARLVSPTKGSNDYAPALSLFSAQLQAKIETIRCMSNGVMSLMSKITTRN